MPHATATPAPRPLILRNAWLRRATFAIAGVLLIWLLGWLLLPVLLKWQLQKQGSAALGRTVTVEKVDFKPWTLELTIDGLKVADAAGGGDQLSVRRLYANAEMQSLFRLAPVIDALEVHQPRLTVRHLGGGRYDIDDMLERLNQPKAEEAEDDKPARFAVFNIRLSGGEVDFADDSVQRTHVLRELAFEVPFLSNLAARREVATQPRLAFVLNGSAFDTRAATTPFAQSRETDASIRIPALDLQPYLPYWPARWPVAPTAGLLALDLQLGFEQLEATKVVVSGSATLAAFELQQRAAGGAATDLLAFDRLAVVLTSVEPLQRRVDLASVDLEGPRLQVSRDAADLVNLQRIAGVFERLGADTSTAGVADTLPPPGTPTVASPEAKPKTPPKAKADPAWHISVARVGLSQGAVSWSDAAVKPPAQLALSDLQAQLTGVTWPVQAPVPFELTAALGKTPLKLAGSATDVAASASFSLGDTPLAMAAPYLEQVLAPSLDGNLKAELAFDWRAEQPGQAMALLVRAPSVDLTELRLGPAKKPLASLRRLLVEGVELDMVRRTVAVGKAELTRPELALARDSKGEWMAQRWALTDTDAPAQAADKSGVEQGAEAWKLVLAEVQINDGAAEFKDEVPAQAVNLAFSGLKLQVKNLRPLEAAQAAMPVSLSVRMGAGAASQGDPGRLDFTGSLRLPSPIPAGKDTLLLKGQVRAERLPVHALEPYFGDQLNLELLRADASYKGTLEAAMPPQGLALALAGDLALEDFRANTRSPSEDLLAWKSLNLRGLKVGLKPGEITRVEVAETALADYFARIIVSEDGRINLQGLVKGSESSPSATTLTAGAGGATSPAPAPVVPLTTTTVAVAKVPTAPTTDIRFGPVSLVNGRVYFSDRFIRPNYSANLSELTGALSAFSNASTPAGATPQLADLNLRGKAEGTASLEIVGKLNPLAQPLALDIQGKVRDLELPPLSPYSVKYAGYGMDRGKLSVDVAYRIEPNGQLTASNQIILNQLRFGDRVEGTDAPNLPVKLAVALLADSNGVIDINLPVSGSINDPQFRIGPLIFRLIFNLIGKAITAPFSLLASAFGGGGDELSQVPFAPGRALIDDEAKKRLDTVAKALTARPALQLTVIGHSDLEAERSGFQRARLDERVLAEKRRALAREGGSATATVVVTPAEYPALLKEVYKRADIPKPRNAIGIAKDLPQEEMEKLLLASVKVGEDAMRELAVARGVAVKDYMATRELPEDRMFLGAPRLKSEGDKWQPQAELKLAPR